jgi:N-acetylmuramoyl-L-alanine amidase
MAMRAFSLRGGWALSVALLLAACAAVERAPEKPEPVVVRASSEPEKPVAAARPEADARRCVALAMYWEARGEGADGMLAVGSVIRNRVADSRFPDTFCGVVYQGGETPPCQFSWWCDGKSDRPTDSALWRSALSLADRMLSDPPPDATAGALFFHHVGMRSPWRRQRTTTIGNHVFYR